MGMAVPYYSVDMVRALPDDGNRYETVHGELLVTPAPTAWHQEVTDRLRATIRAYLQRHPVGHLFSAPADISWGPDILVQPDLFVVNPAEARTMDWQQMKTVLLVVEVLSPSTARFDRFTKRRLYQEVSIPTYWVVDLDGQCVEVWTPDMAFPSVERERVVWTPTGAGEPLEVDIRELLLKPHA
jgi:Uma2 family endonuclease